MKSKLLRYLNSHSGFFIGIIRSPFHALIFCSVLLAALFTGQACSFLRGSPMTADSLELSSQDLGKISDLPGDLAKVFQGQMSNQQIRSTFESLRSALEYFRDRTRGSAPGAYSVEDMRSFFGKYFFKGKMNPNLAQSLMKLKKGMIGGSDQWLTKSEITTLVGFVGSIQEETVLLSSFMKILSFQEDSAAGWNKAAAALTQLRSSLHKLLDETSLAQSDLSSEDFKNLFLQLAESTADPASAQTYRHFAGWAPLLESIQALLFAGDPVVTPAASWNRGLDGFMDFYGLFVKSNLFVSQQALQDREDIQQISQFLSETLALVTKTSPVRKTGELPFVALDELVEKAFEAGLISPAFKTATLQNFYRSFVFRFFDSTRPDNSSGPSALKPAHLEALQREIDVWRLAQGFTDQLNFPADGFTSAQLASLFDGYDISPVLTTILHSDSATLQASWLDFGSLIKISNPLVFDDNGRLKMAPVSTARITWRSLTRVNMMKAVARLLMIGYGDRSPSEGGSSLLLEADLARWYADFQDIGRELKAFDPRQTDPARSSFMEANFFTPHGNGDDKIDFIEGFEYVSFLFSAGSASAGKIRADLQTAGCELNELDVMGLKKFEPVCFKAAVRGNFAAEYSNVPKLVSQVQSMTAANWEIYFQNALAAGRMSDPSAGKVEVSDVRAMPVVLHYIESLLMIYDTDGSQSLSLQEIYASYPRFADFLRQANPGVSDDDLKDGFAYMLFYGYQPSPLEMVGFKVAKNIWNYQARRADLVKVIQVLKTAAGSN